MESDDIFLALAVDDFHSSATLAPSTDDGAQLLNNVRLALARYVVLPSDEAMDAVTLWIVATHFVSCLDHATRLAIHSPLKRCGKSRLLEVIAGLAHEPLETTSISTAALFRVVDRAGDEPPTLILDEADRIFGSAKKDEDAASLIGALNNGFRRGSPTWRCVGPKQEPVPFSNYAFVVLAGIGRKPDTIEDRAVNIVMRRRLPGERVAKFRLRTDLPRLHSLRDQIAAWAASKREAVERAVRDESNVPAQLEDRAQDCWEPLCAVAAIAGDDWPEKARKAALRLTAEAADEDGEQSLDLRLLSDVRTVFESGAAFISTATLLDQLRRLEESPWHDFDFTARRLSMRLGKFGIKPRRNTTGTERGYYRSDLRDPFSRYLPSEPSEASNTPPDLPILPDTS